MRNKITSCLLLLTLYLGGCIQNKPADAPKESPSLSVKKNAVCSKDVLCVIAEFRLNRSLSDDKTMITKMDKEMPGCFEMMEQGNTVLPVAVERVNNGIPDELVYALYFENKAKENITGKKIIYNDRFFGWKNKEFFIERN